jgi:ribosomal protein S18 acetylase RimI-like enzyme
MKNGAQRANIQLVTDLSRLPEVTEFFVGWSAKPSQEQFARTLRGSDIVIVAVDGSTDAVMGFITAITDGCMSAYIPLLEVLPEYQKQGIGTLLFDAMLKRLKDFYMIDLVCDPSLKPYYERFGMFPQVAMSIRKPDVLGR